MVFLATDLDRTIIFSYKFLTSYGKSIEDYTCVETYNNKPLSFIPKSSYKYLSNLLKTEDKYLFIPTTTRSIKQFKRINLIPEFPIAIVDNGGTILYKGKPIKEWTNYIKSLEKRLRYSYNEIYDMFRDSDLYEKKPKFVDDLFLFIKLKDVKKSIISKFLYKVQKKLKNTDWEYTLQGLKLYILPKYICKENAVEYVSNYLLPEYNNIILTSGDGKLDIGLIEYGDISFIPKHSEAYKILESDKNLRKGSLVIKGFYKKNYVSRESTEEILKYFEEIKNEFTNITRRVK